MSPAKPNQAFGLYFEPGSTLWRQVRDLAELTVPSVSPFCYRNLTFPFLIFQSQSNAGNIRTAENQLANAAVKALDILRSIHLEDKLFVLGIVHVEFSARLYMCTCTRKSGVPEALVDKVSPISVVSNTPDCIRY